MDRPAAGHRTKLELAQRAEREAAKKAPRLGWPVKPQGMPRSLSRLFDQVCLKLRRKGILWSTDGPLVEEYCQEKLTHQSMTPRMKAIAEGWAKRTPFTEPTPTGKPTLPPTAEHVIAQELHGVWMR